MCILHAEIASHTSDPCGTPEDCRHKCPFFVSICQFMLKTPYSSEANVVSCIPISKSVTAAQVRETTLPKPGQAVKSSKQQRARRPSLFHLPHQTVAQARPDRWVQFSRRSFLSQPREKTEMRKRHLMQKLELQLCFFFFFDQERIGRDAPGLGSGRWRRVCFRVRSALVS